MPAAPVWKRVGTAAVFVAVVAACLPAAYYAIFNQFSGYDDEGYFLVSIKLVEQGQRLYDDVATGYGPVYYLVFVPILDLLGITHDTGRFVTLATWCLGSVAFGEAVRRVTQSIGFGVAAFATCFALMSISIREPMNPGPILFLLCGCAVLACLAERARTGPAIAIGALTAAAVLVKLNVGAFAFVAAAYALMACSRPSPRTYWAFCTAAFVALPLVVLVRDLDLPEVQHYALLVVGSGAALAWAGAPRGPRDAAAAGAERRMVVPFLAAAVGTGLVALVLAMLALGATPSGLYEGIVTRAREQRDTFWILKPVTWAPLLVAVPLLAVWARRPRWAPGFLAAARLAGGGAVLALAFTSVAFGSASFVPVVWGIPLAWLAIAQPSPDFVRHLRARRMLAAMAVLEALYAYPVAGAQRGFASAFVMPVAVIVVHDGFRQLAPRAAAVGPLVRRLMPVTPLLLGLSLAFVVAVAPLDRMKRDYNNQTALPFPGAERIHVEPADAQRLVFLVDGLKPCSTFVPVLGMNSLYLFADKQPPAFMPQSWHVTLDDRRQLEVIRRLRPDPRSCAVYSQTWQDFWDLTGELNGPLLRFLRANYVRSGPDRLGEFVLVRRASPS